MKIFKILILGVLFSVTVAAQSRASADPLKPFTKCKPGNGLKVSELTRYVKTGRMQREVQTASGVEKVSVVDGYHLAFRFRDLSYNYASVKLEQSDAPVYLQNREAIIASLKYLSTSDQGTPIVFTDKSMLNGFEHYGIDRDRIDVGEVVGTRVFFSDRLRLTITIYFLNQLDRRPTQQRSGGNRKFDSIAEYHPLRDEFLTNYSECLEKVAADQPA